MAAASGVGGLTQPFETRASQNLVTRTRSWTAPGSVDAAVRYLKSHAPPGMTLGGWSTSNGGTGPQTEGVAFESRSELELTYTLAASHGAVAVRADASTIWVPARPSWSMLRTPLADGQAVIIRQNPQLHGGAPTIRRALSPNALRRVVDAIDALPLSADIGAHSCPATVGGEVWRDTVTVRAGGRSVRIVDNLSGCATLEVTVGTRTVQLGGSIDGVLLSLLGLPADYGAR